MVCDRVYSEDSRHSGCQYGPISNSESDAGSENSQKNSFLNTNYDGRSHASPGSQNSLSHLSSSWIQRLIPYSDLRATTNSMWPSSRRADTGNLAVSASQPKAPVYENSRRGKLNFYDSSKTSMPGIPQHNANESSCWPYESSNSFQSKLQVSPNPLPLVESLLEGDRVHEMRKLMDEYHFQTPLSMYPTAFNEKKHAAQYPRGPTNVTCNSFQRINSRNRAPSDGPFPLFESNKAGKKLSLASSSIAPYHPGNSQQYVNTNFKSSYMNMPEPSSSLYTPSIGRRGYVGNVLSDEPPIQSRVEGTGSISNSSTHSSYLFPKTVENSTREVGCSYPEDPWQSGTTTFRDNAEKPKNTLSHQMAVQTHAVSHSSHKEQSGASESFSFHFGRLFPSPSEHAQAAEVEWSFPTKLEQTRNAAASRTSEEGMRFFEASKPANPHNSFTTFEKRNYDRTSFMDGQMYSYGISKSAKPNNLNPLMGSDRSSYKQNYDDFERMNKSAFHPTGVEEQERANVDRRGVHHWSEMQSKLQPECSKDNKLTHSYAPEGMPPYGLYPPDLKQYNCTGAEPGRVGINEEFRFPNNHNEYKRPGGFMSSLGKRYHDSGTTVTCSVSKATFDGGQRETAPALWEKPDSNPKMWLQRWFSASSKANLPSDSNLIREGTISKDKLHHVDFYEGVWRTMQGSSEVSHLNYDSFDRRPTKRMCNENRLGTSWNNSEFGTLAQTRQPQTDNTASHFMKRFFTPSAAAMAIMGTTARHVRATQPQKKGLFGVWNLPSKRPSSKAPLLDTSKESETVKQSKPFPNLKEKIPPVVDA